ncbi:MAG: hypothetical protein ACRD8A_11160 [Candidatus Acidiferrales bacterium]
MNWFETTIRRYEHMRWAQETGRRILPFAWGLEHIGGNSNDPDPRGFLNRFVDQTVVRSDEWFAVTPTPDYELRDGILTFTSQIASPWPENNRVYGQLFRARRKGPAVVVLAQWNARWEEQRDICRWLSRLGITAIKISLPYHDRRSIPGYPRADHLVGPNIGLTLQANRQAVVDVRRTLLWLANEGYHRLGILGTSVGSAISFVTICHEPLLRAGAFLRRHILRRRSCQRPDNHERLGIAAAEHLSGGTPAFLVANQSVCLYSEAQRNRKKDPCDQRPLRSHFLA